MQEQETGLRLESYRVRAIVPDRVLPMLRHVLRARKAERASGKSCGCGICVGGLERVYSTVEAFRPVQPDELVQGDGTDQKETGALPSDNRGSDWRW